MTILKMVEPTQIVQSAQVWVCETCGTQDHKSCSCNSPARMEILAAKREANRQANRRHREKDKENQQARDNHIDVENTKESENGKDSAAARRAYYAAIEDGGDSEAVCWRRGLLYRATNAAGEAKYEDWTEFEIDAELVRAAEQAALAWNETAAYLRRLYENPKA